MSRHDGPDAVRAREILAPVRAWIRDVAARDGLSENALGTIIGRPTAGALNDAWGYGGYALYDDLARVFSHHLMIALIAIDAPRPTLCPPLRFRPAAARTRIRREIRERGIRLVDAATSAGLSVSAIQQQSRDRARKNVRIAALDRLARAVGRRVEVYVVPNHSPQLDGATRARILDEARRGHRTRREIAAHLAVSYDQVKQVLRGVEVHTTNARDDDRTGGRRCAPETPALLADARTGAFTVRQLMERYGLSRKQVERRLSHHRVSLRAARQKPDYSPARGSAARA